MRKFIILLLLLVLGSFPAGCAKQKGIRQGEVTDQAGRKVKVGKIKRIVSLWPEATRVLFALGDGGKIVGLDSSSKKGPILTRAFPKKLREISDVGSSFRGTLSIEKLAKLKPDIIFARTEDRQLADKVQQTLGIPVVCVRMDKFNPPQTSFNIITVIGKCLGERERSKELRGYLENKIDKIRSLTAKIPYAKKAKIYAANPYDLNSLIAGATSVEIAGGNSLSVSCKSWSCNVGFEQIANWNPDVILLHAYGKFTLKDLKKDPDWQKIKAVRDNRVYRILFGYTGKDPGLFVVNVLTEAKILYPEKFNYSVEKEANKIFYFLYRVKGLYSRLKKDFKLSEV